MINTVLTQQLNASDISLYQNTVTIYPKQTKKLLVDRIIEKCTQKDEMEKYLRPDNRGVKGASFVHKRDPDHEKLHQDDLDQERPHYHVQFHQTFNAQILTDFLKGLAEHTSIITKKECDDLIKVFKHRNRPSTENTRVVRRSKRRKTSSFFECKEEVSSSPPLSPLNLESNIVSHLYTRV